MQNVGPSEQRRRIAAYKLAWRPPPPPPPPPSTLLMGLAAYWSFDTSPPSGALSLADSSGNGRTLVNNAAVTAAAGLIGNGAVFNASGQNLNTPTFIPLGSNTDFSVWLWALTTNIFPQQMFFTFGNSGVAFEIEMVNNDAIRVTGYNGSTFHLDTPVTLVADTWYPVCVTYDSATSILTVFLPAQALTSSLTITPALAVPTGTVQMGLEIGGGMRVIGMIDEVGVWDRVLTTIEIADLYNAGAGITYPF